MAAARRSLSDTADSLSPAEAPPPRPASPPTPAPVAAWDQETGEVVITTADGDVTRMTRDRAFEVLNDARAEAVAKGGKASDVDEEQSALIDALDAAGDAHPPSVAQRDAAIDAMRAAATREATRGT